MHQAKQLALERIVRALSTLGHTQLAEEVTSYQQAQPDKRLRITVFGEYSVGKSTLINALLGKPLLAARLRPTTGVPAELQYGEDGVRILFRDGRQQDITISEAANYSDLDLNSRANDKVDRIIISTHSSILENGITLVDTPGILDDSRQTERARRELAAADIVLLVLRADHLLSQVERSFAVDWLTEDLGKPTVPIVNFMGLAGVDAHDEIRGILRAFTKKLNKPFERLWYEVDALPALRYRLGLKGASSPVDDYTVFSTELERLSESDISQSKQQSRSRWQASWKRRSKSENGEILRKLEGEARELRNERRVQARQLEEILQRIRWSRDGDRARCVGLLDQHKTGQHLAIANALPPAAELKTTEQRQSAGLAVSVAFNKALEAIDEHANGILMGLAGDANVVLAPISVRELAALDSPPDTEITITEGGASLKWAAILAGGAVVLSGGVLLPIVASFAGLIFGRLIVDTSKQVAEFRQNFCDAVDAQLERLGSLLGTEFNVRIDELIATLEERGVTIRAMPGPSKELALRRELETLVG